MTNLRSFSGKQPTLNKDGKIKSKKYLVTPWTQQILFSWFIAQLYWLLVSIIDIGLSIFTQIEIEMTEESPKKTQNRISRYKHQCDLCTAQFIEEAPLRAHQEKCHF